MRIAVLCSPDSWYFRDLVRAAGTRHELVPLAFTQLAGSVANDGARVVSQPWDLASFDAVLVRTMPPGSLEQVVFRMDLLGRLEVSGQLVLNPPRAIEIAVDKYLATARLAAAGLPVPRTMVCQTVDEALEAFDQLGGDVVLKPLFGSEGRGITRLTDEALAQRAFQLLVSLGAVLYMQEFVEHEGCDIRLLVIGEQVLGMRRSNPHDWRTNVSRGATTEPYVPTAEQVETALRAAATAGAPLAGIDVLPARSGQQYVLEVNAVPGWKALAATLKIDVAQLVLEFTEREVRRSPAARAR